VALRAMIVQGGSFLLPTLYPDVPFEIWKKIEFGSVYIMIGVFPLYVYHLFPEQSPKQPLYFLVSVGIIMASIVLLTRQYTYGSLLEVVHLLLISTFAYAFYSIGKAWRSGNKDAKIILLGVLASFPFILAEILKNSPSVPINIEFNHMVEIGVLVFLLFQVFLLANHFAKSYKHLEALNLNLEKIVNERTTELTTANKVRDRLLSVMSHDIKSPLNALRGLLQVYHRGDVKQEEFGQFTRHIENDLSKTGLLVENILYWTTTQLKGVQVRREKFDLHVLMEENMELFQTVASHKNVSVVHDVAKSFPVVVDRNILSFAVRNLLANAIKFSYEGGQVNIFATRQNGHLNIQIKDHGTGMDEETIQALLKPQQALTTTGTRNETGTGLGVALCSDYLQKGGGQLSVESILGQGTTFTITLPLG
jgi:signal transduction histidine kinase